MKKVKSLQYTKVKLFTHAAAMFVVGSEMYDLARCILAAPRDDLPKSPLFCRMVEITADGSPICMSFEDVFPPDVSVDWSTLCFQDLVHFKLDERRGVVVFDNVHELMYGLQELHTIVVAMGVADAPVKRTLQVMGECLAKIQGYLSEDTMMEEFETMAL
jgi:hypothetical protein